MKRFFTLIFVLSLFLPIYATVTPVAVGENNIEAAIGAAFPGDTLLLSTGTYTEWHSQTISTPITIKAADGASPVVSLYAWSLTADFEMDGLTVNNVSTNNYLLRTGGNVAGTIALKNCTLNNQAGTPFLYLSSNSVGTITIDNCIFTGTTKNQGGIIYAGSSSNAVTNFSMTNSTAYNVAGELAVWMGACTNALVDHCTFYNCGTRVVYLAGTLTTCAVRNCVVASPSAASAYSIANYGGTVENCVYYNLNAPRSGSVDCTQADPLFIDAANADFSFRYASPLYKGATDGTNIGDPRWNMQLTTEVNLPNTLNMANAESYTTPVYNTDYFDFGPNDSSDDLKFFALWTVNVSSGMYDIAVDLTSANGYNLELYLIDIESGSTLKTVTAATSSLSSPRTLDLTDVTAGKYLLMLKNTTAWSKVKVRSIALTYAGGAVVNIPATLTVDDALFSAEGTRADGYITFPASTINKDEIVYSIHASCAANYSMDLTISTTNGHKYLVEVYDNAETLVASLAEASQRSVSGTITLGKISIPAGDYKVKIINQTQWSEAKYQSLTFTYAGGATIELPATIVAEDASEMAGKVEVDANGNIAYINNKYVPDARVKWNIHVAEAGMYQVVLNMNAASTSGHRCQVDVLNSEDEVVASVGEAAQTSAHTAIDLGTMSLPSGKYTLVLINNTEYSSSIVDGITFSYLGAFPTYDLTVSAAGMSTLVLPFDVDVLPAGLKAYQLTTSGNEILATERMSITADQPVLVIGAAGNYHFEGTGSADISGKTGVYTSGALHGTYTGTEAPLSLAGENVYVLQKHGDEVAFYQLDASSNKTINPYRAFLSATYNSLASATPAPMRIRFQTDSPTELEEAAPANSLEEALRNGEVYDLLGRRIYSVPAQGVYIVAGQKMFIH